jgi:type II secretion system protein H
MKKSCGRQSQSGFTLIEALIVIAVMGIITATAMPAFTSWRERTILSNAASIMLGNLQQARLYALTDNRQITVSFNNNAYTFDTGGARQQVFSVPSSISLSTGWNPAFSSRGIVTSAGNVTLTAASGTIRTITVNTIGRAFLN